MEYTQKMLLAVIAILVVFALYIAFTTVSPKPADTSAAEELLLRSMLLGKGLDRYTYSFGEISNGYKTSYSLLRNGDERSLSLQNPLSAKSAYFLKNDTILCVAFDNQSACASVAGNQEVANYLNSLMVKFPNDSIIERNDMDARYLLSKKYIILDPNLTRRSYNGHDCDELTYLLDFTNVSINDAARFGVGPTTPKQFRWSVCVDNRTGYTYEREFNYSYKGIDYISEYQLKAFSAGGSPQIIPPQNLSGDPVALLFKERAQTIKLASCFTDKAAGEERDKCVAVLALEMRRKDLCDLAGARRDRCLVSLIPVLKDNETCLSIADPSYKDDCYIELAGAYRDKTFCLNIKDSSKKPLCEQAATPPAPLPPSNVSGNISIDSAAVPPGNNSGFNASIFMNNIDTSDANGTSDANSNGSALNSTH
jgi:hypothetical protein